MSDTLSASWKRHCTSVGEPFFGFLAVFSGIVPQGMKTIFPSHRDDPSLDLLAASAPGGRFETSPAVHCWVRMNHRTSPAGTAESPKWPTSAPILTVCSGPRIAREWLNRPFGTLGIGDAIPPFKGWASLKSLLREMSVGKCSSDTTAHGRKMSKLYKLHAPPGSEFSCPDMEMIPPKAAGNLGADTCCTIAMQNSEQRLKLLCTSVVRIILMVMAQTFHPVRLLKRGGRRPIVALVAFVSAVAMSPETDQARAATGEVGFNRDIRPIFAENCMACHGPDNNKRKAGLRLDTREGIFEKTPKREPAVVPGKLDKSELWRRVIATNPDDVMPPPDSHKELKLEEKEKLKQWILAGAPWQGHWALVKPERTPLPEAAKLKVQSSKFKVRNQKSHRRVRARQASKQRTQARAGSRPPSARSPPVAGPHRAAADARGRRGVREG